MSMTVITPLTAAHGQRGNKPGLQRAGYSAVVITEKHWGKRCRDFRCQPQSEVSEQTKKQVCLYHMYNEQKLVTGSRKAPDLTWVFIYLNAALIKYVIDML